MWQNAVRVRGRREFADEGVLEHLDDLTREERIVALRETHDRLREHQDLRQRSGGKNPKVLVEQGYGPAKWYELDDPDFTCYNGKDGGENYKWFVPSVFQRELQRMNADLETCTERECELALRKTNAVVGMYTAAYKAGLVEYAGPQCYPQLKEQARVSVNSV